MPGLSEEQASLLAHKLEDAANLQSQDLKAFIRAENAAMEERWTARLEGARADLEASMRQQMLRFVTIVAALLTVAVAVIKLFPDAA